MADVAPKQKTTPRQRIAQLVRLLGSPLRGERVSAWNMLKGAMEDESYTWNDIGNDVEHGGADADGKYTESELQEFAQACRAEGVEAGIAIGRARANGGGGNGHLSLPKPSEMATYCHDRLGQLKDDRQREFVTDMFLITRQGRSLSLGRLGYLVSIYIQIGGRT